MKTGFAALAAVGLLSGCATGPQTAVWARNCPIRMPSGALIKGQGVIVRLLDTATASRTLAATEAKVGAPIDHAYLDNLRAEIRMPDGQYTTVLIPRDMTVAVGDRVAFNGSYRSPDLPCSYVPSLATRKY
jgi:hypothetical protein